MGIVMFFNAYKNYIEDDIIMVFVFMDSIIFILFGGEFVQHTSIVRITMDIN